MTLLAVREHESRAVSSFASQGCRSHLVHRFLSLALLLAIFCHPATLVGQARENSGTFDEWIAKAANAREAGRTAEAIADYQHAVELQPGWEEGWWYLGTLNYDIDHFDDGKKALQKVVELDSAMGEAWAFLGLCEFELQDYKASFAHLQRAQGLGFGEDADVAKVALYHLALLLNLNGEFERSADLLTTKFGSGVVPDPIKAVLGLALLRIPLLPTQVDPAHDAMMQAAGETAALLANRKADAAFASFEQMLAKYPRTPYVHYAYGMALASVSRYKEAESQFDQETKVTAESALAWIGLAAALVEQRRGPEAEAAAQHAIQLDPQSAAAQEVFARALQLTGKSEQAARATAKGTVLRDTPVAVDTLQAKRYSLADKRETSSVAAPSKTSERTGPNADFDELAHRAESAKSAGNIAEATRLYEAALKVRPEWGEGWLMLGTFAYMEGRFSDAVTALRKSVKLDAKRAEAWTVLGLTEFKIEDYPNSLIHLKRASDLGFGGNRAAVQFAKYHLALLLNLNGEFDRALELLISEAGTGALAEKIQFGMGISLLRIAKLPDQILGADRSLVLKAGGAATLLSESRYDLAFPIFDELIRGYPDTPFLHFAYGSALASTSNYDQARVQLLEETKLNPLSALAYVRLASISLILHDPQQALQFANKAVAIAPESAETHYVVGRSLLEIGDAQGAVNALEISRRLAPGSPAVHFNLARAYTKIHRSTDADRERAEFERLQAEDHNPATMGVRPPHSPDATAGESFQQNQLR